MFGDEPTFKRLNHILLFQTKNIIEIDLDTNEFFFYKGIPSMLRNSICTSLYSELVIFSILNE